PAMPYIVKDEDFVSFQDMPQKDDEDLPYFIATAAYCEHNHICQFILELPPAKPELDRHLSEWKRNRWLKSIELISGNKTATPEALAETCKTLNYLLANPFQIS